MNQLFIKLEWKQMLRSRWMQLVGILFIVVFAAIAVIQQLALPVDGFTRQTASFLNLLLFLLPLFVLTIGSMSVASDVESGWYSLLKTYPLSLGGYIFGKYVSLVLSFFLILLLSFAVVLIMSGIAGAFQLPLVFVFLAILTVLIFAAIAILCGVIAKNRLHALALSLVVWAASLLLLSYVLMAIGTFVAGHIMLNLTIIMIHLNPAEWIRFGYFLFSGQTTVLGPSFFDFTAFYNSFLGYLIYIVVSAAWILGPLGLAQWLLSRKGRVE